MLRRVSVTVLEGAKGVQIVIVAVKHRKVRTPSHAEQLRLRSGFGMALACVRTTSGTVAIRAIARTNTLVGAFPSRDAHVGRDIQHASAPTRKFLANETPQCSCHQAALGSWRWNVLVS